MTRQIWAINKFKQFRIVFSPSRNSSITKVPFEFHFFFFFCYWIELNRHKRVSLKFSFEYFSPFEKKKIFDWAEKKNFVQESGEERRTDRRTTPADCCGRFIKIGHGRLFFSADEWEYNSPHHLFSLISIIFCGNEFFKKRKKGSKRQKICTTRYFYIFLPLYLLDYPLKCYNIYIFEGEREKMGVAKLTRTN